MRKKALTERGKEGGIFDFGIFEADFDPENIEPKGLEIFCRT